MKIITINNINIYLHNNANINYCKDIKKAIELTALPKSNIFLLFSDKEIINRRSNGTEEKLLGYTFCEFFDKFFDGIFRDVFCCKEYIESTKFDCWIAVSKKVCEWKERYPAYFTFLLGHELGHAKMILENKFLDIICCFVQLNIWKASNGTINATGRLPHERFCNRIGIEISEQIFGREKSVSDLHDVYNNFLNKDKINELEEILDHSGPSTYPAIIEELEELIRPYKNELQPEWENLAKKFENGDKSKTIEAFEKYLYLD